MTLAFVMGTVFVLVGPKGSGKTTVGLLLERERGVRFVEVEAIAKREFEASGGVIDDAYAKRAMDAVGAAVGKAARLHPLVAMETTGTAPGTHALLDALAKEHDLRLVRIRAGRATCRSRIAARDSSRQVPVSDELIDRMHAASLTFERPWDLELENDPPLPPDQILAAFEPLFAGKIVEPSQG